MSLTHRQAKPRGTSDRLILLHELLHDEAAFVALVAAFPLSGAAMRRWLALLYPAIGWPLFYIGLNRDWWGHGTGDGWQYIAVLMTTVGIVTTGLGVAVARAVWPLRPREL